MSHSQLSTSRKPVVYLIASPSVAKDKAINLTPAYEHGEVHVVVPPGKAPVFEAELCMDIIEKHLEDFDPDVDYLLWAGGDALAAIMAGMALANMDIWCFTWLRYERRRLPNGQRVNDGAKYVPVTIDLRNQESENGRN